MRKAIVVDDEPITRLDLCDMLTELEFNVIGAAADGFDAVEMCKKQKPDILLMDINMPVFDGLSSTERIINEHLCDCVIIITGYSTHDIVERSARLGVSGYIVKPISKEQLYSTIEVAFAQKSRQQSISDELQKTRRHITQSRLVDRAKAQLAKKMGISEADAYREMQKLAMNKRCSIASLSQAMLHNSEHQVITNAKQILIAKGFSDKAAYKHIVKCAENKNISVYEAANNIIIERKNVP